MKKTILLTGGTGFVGKHFSKRLHKDGHHVYNLMSNGEVEFISLKNTPTTLPCYDGTFESLQVIIEKVKPTVVFHLASIAVTNHSSEQLDKMLLVNIFLPTQLMEAIYNVRNCVFITLGSAWQHHLGDSYNPIGLYGATKQSVENIAQFYSNTHKLTAVHLKPFHIYGLNDQRQRLVDFLIKATKSPNKDFDMSDGNQLVNLIHIEDVIEALILSMELKKGIFHSYSLESSDWLSVRDLVMLIEKVSGENLSINWGVKANNAQDFNSPQNFGVIMPKWKPLVNLSKGLKELLEQ